MAEAGQVTAAHTAEGANAGHESVTAGIRFAVKGKEAMTLRRLIPLTVLLLAATGACARADDEEPHLKDRTVVGSGWFFCDHLEFSRDGRTLFGGGIGDRKVRVWDVTSEKLTASLRQGVNGVVEFTTSPDGKLLATVSRCGMVWIWDAHTLKKIRSLEGPEDTARLLFGLDSETLSAVAEGKLYVCRINKDEGFRLERQIHPHRAYDQVIPVAYSGSMKRPLLACGNRLFDAVTGGESYRLSEGEFDPRISGLHVAITADEKKLATASMGGFINLWNRHAWNDNLARRNRLTLAFPTKDFRCLSFSPNNQILAVGYDDSLRRGTRGGGILFLDAASGEVLDTQDARIDSVHALAFSPDGRLLATADGSGVIKLWDVPAAWRKKAK